MTQKSDRTLIPEILEKIAGQGLDVLPELIRIVLNIAMQAERQAYLGVQPYERSPHRREHANGCKPKTMATRMGEITFDVPQIRKGDFYPSALERGIRNKRALTLALVET
jgi:putative transposase